MNEADAIGSTGNYGARCCLHNVEPSVNETPIFPVPAEQSEIIGRANSILYRTMKDDLYILRCEDLWIKEIILWRHPESIFLKRRDFTSNGCTNTVFVSFTVHVTLIQNVT